MSLKRFILTMASVALLGAIVASSASAAAVTKASSWHSTGTTISGHVAAGCEAPGGLTLTGNVSGLETNLKATGVECIEASIYNEGGAALDEGKLRFTGVTVENIPTCSVEGGVIETNPLQTELYMDSVNTSVVYDKFEPKPGFTNFATVHLTGASCPVAGNRPVKGYVYGQSAYKTGEEHAEQPLEFSNAVDAAAGSALKFAGNEAHMMGTAFNYLLSEEPFGAN
jgi:hypothetical protein